MGTAFRLRADQVGGMVSNHLTLRKTLGKDRPGWNAGLTPLGTKNLLGERPQQEQADIKQRCPYSCIVLAVLEIERHGKRTEGTVIPGNL